MRITLIGSGNVATHLAAALKNAGHKIIQVYSPNYQNAVLLAYHVGAAAIDDLSAIDQHTDIFIVSVKDDVIEEIAAKLAPHQKLIVHTSGATALLPGTNTGVFYPLQTFSKTKEVDFRQVPLCIEGSNEQITELLEELGRTISNKVSCVNSGQRKILHLAAVFACNFPNALYAMAQGLLADHQLDFNLLRPLILETAEKVQQNLPANVQTGPAVRRDQKTMDNHLELLNEQPVLQHIYKTLSQCIIKMDNDLNGDK
ncbi:Rossmann-like and DUF2520 domain-containing protein [Mucilaginibacter sp. AW1-3]